VKRFKWIAVAAAIVAAPVGALGQQTMDVEIPPEFMAALQKDLTTLRMDAMQTTIQLEPGTASTFWGIYEEYLVELEDVTAGRAELLKDYALQYETLSDDQIMTLGRRAIGQRMDHAALISRYFERIGDEVGGRAAGQFYQIENQVQMLIDLRLAMEIPIIEG
jgi:hypothetical protein